MGAREAGATEAGVDVEARAIEVRAAGEGMVEAQEAKVAVVAAEVLVCSVVPTGALAMEAAVQMAKAAAADFVATDSDMVLAGVGD